MTGRLVGTVIAGVTLSVAARAMEAQQRPWAVAVAVAAGHYGGTSTDGTAPGPSAIRPHNPTVVTLTVERRIGPVRLGLSASRGRSNIGIVGGGVLLVTSDLRTTCYRVSPQVGLALWRSAHDGAVWLSAGPTIAFWQVKPSPEDRTRLGGEATLSFEQSLAGAVAGVVRLTGTLTPSLFMEGELPLEYVRRATWSVALGLGLMLRR